MLKKCNSEVEQNIIIKKDNLYMVLKMDNKAIEILTKKNIELTATDTATGNLKGFKTNKLEGSLIL